MGWRWGQVLARSSCLAAAAIFLAWPTVPAIAATKTIVITSTLSPKAVSVEEGTRVVWRNNDDDRHRMRSREEGAEFDSGDLEQGDTFAFTFSRAGTFSYLDERNDEDRDYWGTVTVKGSTAGVDPPDGTTGADAATVTIGDRVFSPARVKIAKGGTVTWINRDDREHTATGSTFDSGTLAEGARFSERFSAAGTFRYLCEIHPDMTASVVVGTGGATKEAPKPPSGASAEVPEPQAGSATVKIVDLAFTPAKVTVEQDGTVTWVNTGSAPHTVTADGFDSGRLDPGDRYRRRFTRAGTYAYLCAIHPEMRGVVAVADAAGAVPRAGRPPREDPRPDAVQSEVPSQRPAVGIARPREALLSRPSQIGAVVLGPVALLVLVVLLWLRAAGPRPVVPGDPSVEQIHYRLDMKV